MVAWCEQSDELLPHLQQLLDNWEVLTPEEQSFALKYAQFAEKGCRTNAYIDKVRPILHPKQKRFLGLSDLEVLFGGAAGGSKALALDTKLATPSGWSTMGEIQVGDFVFGDDGKPCKVLAVSDVFVEHECYKVTFDDGSEIVADAGHLWATKTESMRTMEVRRTEEFRKARREKRPARGKNPVARKLGGGIWPTKPAPSAIEITTEQMRKSVVVGKTRRRINHSIDNAKPLEIPEAKLPIHPYVLGCWLGDGSSYRPHFTVGDDELIKHLEDSQLRMHKLKGKYAWGTDYNYLAPHLKSLGLIGNKHIPPIYLRSSHAQRLDLLQGLLDTDGTATKEGKVQFCNCNENIARGVFELAASLGLKPSMRLRPSSLYGKECTPHWLVQLTTDKPVFRLSRKLARLAEKSRPTQLRRFVVSVEPVESVPVRCIAVDSPSHLYLAGPSMIPTHNSDSLLLAALQYVDLPDYSAVIFRRTFTDLKLAGAIMDRSHQWLTQFEDDGVKWNDRDKQWTFPSGSRLSFGYMEGPSDRDRYRSAEYQFVGFDECTEIDPDCFLFMFSRLRRNGSSPIPLRFRAATNPGGKFGEFYKKRYIPDEYASMSDLETKFGRLWETSEPCADCQSTGRLEGDRCFYCDGLGKQVRKFLPARAQDNPSLDVISYRKNLAKLGHVVRQQMERGDWNVAESGGIFSQEWFRTFRMNGDYIQMFPFDEHLRPLPSRTVARRDCVIFVTADTALKAKTTADYSVICTWAFHRQTGSLCLLKAYRGKVDAPGLKPLISTACLEARAQFVLIEEAASGIELIQILRKNNECIGGIPVKSYLPGSADKVSRSVPAQIRMESGLIFFPDVETPEIAAGKLELIQFNKAPHDDFVDNVSMAAWYAENHNTIHIGGGANAAPVEIAAGPSLPGRRMQFG